MKLHHVRVREFKSVWDSTSFEVGRVTCLVGKNEAGKTALLEALERLNPIIPSHSEFNVTAEYPRSKVKDYELEIKAGRRGHAIPILATFTLEDAERAAIKEEYGDGALDSDDVEVSKSYEKNSGGNRQIWVKVPVNEAAITNNLISRFGLQDALRARAVTATTLAGLLELIAEIGDEQNREAAAARAAAAQVTDPAEKAAAIEKSKTLEESAQAKALRARLLELLAVPDLGMHIWNTILRDYFPRFVYFDQYYQLSGQDNVVALKQRRDTKKLLPSDYPLLGLIALARLELEDLVAPKSTRSLLNDLEGASNHLSEQILRYWSQNKHLRLTFDVRAGHPEDPEGMRSGMNIWGSVVDRIHSVTTGLGTRSRGFVWFFSFLAWYSDIKREDQPLVLLLDEPGLSLHGKAQEDLLKYFEAEIASNPRHQLIYTTHSPFMVDSHHFDRVRIVQDKGIDSDVRLPADEEGTKVFTDVLEAGPDSLFPLQGALGYEVYQTLFIGPNCLIVEGASDLLYLQSISGLLESQGRIGLSEQWTITPVGGADKVPTFVALISSQKNLRVATLIDFQKAHQQMIENLYRRKLLEKSHVLTFAQFTGGAEADIEDMFDDDYYLTLVNEEFAGQLVAPLLATALPKVSPRVVARIEEYEKAKPLKGGVKFNHYRPARFFAERAPTLKVPEVVLERFEAAFKAVNALLPA